MWIHMLECCCPRETGGLGHYLSAEDANGASECRLTGAECSVRLGMLAKRRFLRGTIVSGNKPEKFG